MGKKIRHGKQSTKKKSRPSPSSSTKDEKKHKNKSLWNSTALEDDLEAMGLRTKCMEPDGNCFFRALGDQLFGDEERHTGIREQVLQFLEDNREMFELFVADDESFDDYISRMKEPGSWAGDLEVHAASLLFQVDICIFQAGEDGLQCLCNKNPESKKTIHISYHDGEHYNSVRNGDDYEDAAPTSIVLDKDGSHISGDIPTQKNWTWRDERHIMQNTGCSNEGIIHKFLEEHNGEIDRATEAIIEWQTKNRNQESNDASSDTNVTKDLFEDLLPGWASPGEDSQKQDSEGQGAIGEYERNIEDSFSEAASKPVEKKTQQRPSNKKSCPCGSRKKYKACCKPRDLALARKVQKKTDSPETQVDARKKLNIAYI